MNPVITRMVEEGLLQAYSREVWLRTKKKARTRLAKLPRDELVRIARQLLERRFGPDNYDYLESLDFYSLTEVIIYNLGWLALRLRR